MSGPSLAKQESHHAIHMAAFGEAEQLTRILRALVLQGDLEKAPQVADILIEHWRTRTLAHAECEEEGLYLEVLQEHPERAFLIHQLKRDHDLLRKLLGEIEGILADKGWSSGILERFEAMLLVNVLHSRDEETFLLATESPDTETDTLSQQEGS